MGLGAGFGLAYLYFYIKPTYMTAKQVREITGLPVLGMISMQYLGRSNDKKRVFMFVSFMVGLVFVYLGLMSFEYLRLKGINLFDLIHKVF